MNKISQRRMWRGLAVITFASAIASAEDLSLKGGATLTAPIIKKTDRIVVLDLGFDVLVIPATEVLEIREEPDPAAADRPATHTSRIYSMADSKRLTTAEAVERFGASVVMVKTPKGLGSGFFISRRGHLITNFHVIRGEKRITVTQFVKGGKGVQRILHQDVDIIAVAPFHDLAVLQIKRANPQIVSAVLAPQDNVRNGERIFVIGNPLGLEQTVTEGVISQAQRNFKGILYRQIDAPVNPGNSGGPLFNDRGQVVGVINMKVPFMEGLNFAIPIMHVKYILDHLDAFAYDKTNAESGYVYPDPPPRPGIRNPAADSPDNHGNPPTQNERNADHETD